MSPNTSESFHNPSIVSGEHARQIPLAFGSHPNDAIGSLLTLTNPEAQRIYKLLMQWSVKYGSVTIRVDNNAILVGDSRINLSDINAKNAFREGIYNLEWVLAIPVTGELLFDWPRGDILETETWMELVDKVPGSGAERARNLMELLGHDEQTEHCAYWSEALGPYDDGKYYWLFTINIDPRYETTSEDKVERYMQEQLLRDHRQSNDVIAEYPDDLWIHDFGDQHIFFNYSMTGWFGLLRTNA